MKINFWVFNGMKMKLKLPIISFLLLMIHLQLFVPCSSLNSEGVALMKFKEGVIRDPFNALSNWINENGDLDHCSWFGVFCSDDGSVISLNLKDLCLGGTLAPELGKLSHIQSIILRNNSYDGTIPGEIADLEELEMLDLGYNNLSGPLPSNFGNNFSLSILLLDNNYYLGGLTPELNQLQMQSEHQVDEKQLRGVSAEESCNSKSLSWYTSRPDKSGGRNLLLFRGLSSQIKQIIRRDSASAPSPSIARSPVEAQSPSPSPSPSHRPSHVSPSPSPFSSPSPPSSRGHTSSTPVEPSARPPSLPPVVSESPARAAEIPRSFASTKNHHKVIIWASVAGGSAFIIIAAATIFICRSNKMGTVKPWATGLSGQLQRALVAGVPNLKRTELETACEDFSNIIGSLNDGTVYKGTLSSGIEMAVVATSVKSSDGWSRKLEAQFRKKIETLSKVNHKNFVNLIGYCVEEKPFTRMMVFEYAPNGTLFEHLHIQEAERLDWKMRLRVVMGMAYCLEHMHQLNPHISHRDLQSSSIYLSEDYATKLSDFSFWTEGMGSKMRSPSKQLLEAAVTDIEGNVYNFGLVLLEIITGRMPFMEDNISVADWVFDCLDKDHFPQDMIDPTLSSFKEEDVRRLFNIIKDCVHPDPRVRPTMKDIISHLRDITGMGPDVAAPRLSPLWWAELEVLSMDGS